MNGKKYHCMECGKDKEVTNQVENPICCGEKMEFKEMCISPVTAENSHLEAEDPPCDDGSSGYRV